MAPTLRTVPSLFAITVFAASTQAQTSPYSIAGTHAFDWQPGGPVGRGAAGYLTGDGRLDGLYTADGGGWVVYAPDKHSSVFEIDPGGPPVNDLAVLPASSAGGLDEVVTVGAQGLGRYRYDSGSGSFTSEPIGFAGDNAWNGATRVIVVDRDKDGEQDLVGLSALGGALLVLYGPLDDPPAATLAAPLGVNRAHDVAVLDWDDAGAGDTLEVALLMPTLGVNVFSDDGTAGAVLPIDDVDTGVLAPFGQAGFTGQRLAALVTLDTGVNELHVIDRTDTEDPVVIGSAGAYAAVAGDADGDGKDDVFLAHTESHDLKLMYNQGGASTFTLADVDLVDLRAVGPAPNQTAWPLLGPFTGSGNVDVVCFVEQSQKVIVADNQYPGPDDPSPQIYGGDYYYSVPDQLGEIVLNLDSGPPYPFPAHPWANRLEIILWAQEEWFEGEEMPQMQHQAHSRDLFPIAQSVGPGAEASVFLSEPQAKTSMVYNIEMRYIKEGTAGKILRASPSSTYAFSSNEPVTENLGLFYGNLLYYELYKSLDGENWNQVEFDLREEEDPGGSETPVLPPPDEDPPRPDGPPSPGTHGG